MSHDEKLLVVPESHAGLRLDVALQQLLPEFSRSKLQEWIKEKFVLVNESHVSSKHKVYAGDEIKVSRVHRAHRVLKVHRVSKVLKVFRDYKVLLVL